MVPVSAISGAYLRSLSYLQVIKALDRLWASMIEPMGAEKQNDHPRKEQPTYLSFPAISSDQWSTIPAGE